MIPCLCSSLFSSCTAHHKQKILRRMSEDFCGRALSTAAEPLNRLQHSDTEFQRFPQRTLSPISLIMSINIRKRVGSVEDLPEKSTSLPGASSQCGTLHLNGCTSFCSAIPHHILCFPEEPVRCPFLKIFCPMGQLLVGAYLPQTLLIFAPCGAKERRVVLT